MALNVKGDITVARKLSAMGNKQGNFYQVDGFVDFTTAEPAHVAGEIFVNTVAGTGSTTTATTFNQHSLYRSNGTNFYEFVPQTGWALIDITSNVLFGFNGTSWESLTDLPTRTETAATGVDIDPDFTQNVDFRIDISSSSTGDINVLAPSGDTEDGERVFFAVTNSDGSGARNLVFDSVYKNFDGSDIGTAEISNFLNYRNLQFVKVGSVYRLVDDSDKDNESNYDLVNQLKVFDTSTGLGHFVADLSDGTGPAVRLSGSNNTDSAFYEQEVDVAQRDIKIVIKKDTTSLSGANLRISGPTGYADFFINPTDGSNSFDLSNAAGEITSYELLSFIELADTFEYVVRVTPATPAQMFVILIPDYSLIADITTSDVTATGTLTITDLDLDYNFTTNSASGESLQENVIQTAHGFNLLDVLYNDGTQWQLAQADDGATVAQSVVTEVVDVNTFVITTHGKVTVTGHGLSVGEYYWLDQTIAGGLNVTQPTSGIFQGILHTRDANTLFIDVEQAIQGAEGGTSVSLIYDEIFKTTNQNTTNTDTVDVTDLTYTITQDGKYEISYTLQVIMANLAGSAIDFFLTDGSDNLLGGFTRFQYNATDAGSFGEQIYGTQTLDLVAGDVVKVRVTDGSAGANATIAATLNQSKLIIKQLPSSEIVPAGAAQVDDVEVLLGSGATDTGNISINWDQISAAGYTQVRFWVGENISTGVGNKYSGSSTIDSSWLIGDDGGFERYINIAGTDSNNLFVRISDETSNSLIVGGQNQGTNPQWAVYGIKPQKSVIDNLNTVVNDQASSGYIDIGNTRIQWGVEPSNDGPQTVTLPAPFANTNYSLVITMQGTGVGTITGPAGTVGINIWTESLTATSFNIDRDDDIDNALHHWQAIGVKP